MALHNKWTSHLKDEGDKVNFRKAVFADGLVLGRLLAILDELESELDNRELSLEQYNSPAFPYLKADQTGERRALNKVKLLLAHLKED